MTANIIFRDGFDMYNGVGANIGVEDIWSISPNPNLVSGRFSGQALRPRSPFNGGGMVCFAQLASDVSLMTFGFAFKRTVIEVTYSQTFDFAALDTAATPQFGIKVTTGGVINVVRIYDSSNHTIIGNSVANTIRLGVWHYIEIEAKLHVSAGEIHVYVDGNPTAAVSLTGVKTTSDNATTGTIRFINAGAMRDHSDTDNSYFDDMYVLDAMARLGPRKIETLRVNGNGSTQNFVCSTGTDHGALVDEVLVDTTDYVYSSTAGNIDEFAMQDVPTTPYTIDEVNVVGWASKDDASPRALNLGINSGGTMAYGADHYLGTNYAKFHEPYATNPDGSIAWTKTAVDALLTRVKVAV